MRASIKYCLRIALFLLVVCSLMAGDQGSPASREFDEAALATYPEDADFQYQAGARQGETWISRALYWLTQNFFRLLNTPGGTELSRILWYVFWGVVAIGAIALIIRIRYGKVLIGSRDKEHRMPVSVESEQHVDYRAALEDARQTGQLQLAARYLFLYTIQQLNQRGFVQWKKWKTSYDYASEIPREKRAGYLALSQFFESSWFGGHEPSGDELNQYLELSNQLVDA